MPRGRPSTIGEEMTSQNGYKYRKTATGWRLEHHVLMEEKLGRPLREGESVYFIDNNRANLSVDNLAVRRVGQRTTAALKKRKAVVEQRIADYTTELRELEQRIKEREAIEHGEA